MGIDAPQNRPHTEVLTHPRISKNGPMQTPLPSESAPSESVSPSVLVVDDHPMWRDAVAGDLTSRGFTVTATAGSVEQAVGRALATRPDVVLMDMNLPDGNGVQATQAILAASQQPPAILVLSASSERTDVLDAVRAGASGYLLKSASAEELERAVRDVAVGKAVFTPELAGQVLAEMRGRTTGPPEAKLTPRETEVLRMVAKGLASKQIARRLDISPRTVDNHIAATLRKLQLGNRVELARYAIENGMS